MTYEVHFQLADAQYTVRGPDIDGVLRLIQGVQAIPPAQLLEPYTPADNPWIDWAGGSCPVPAETKVEVELCDGQTVSDRAGRLAWWHDCAGDIVRYRVCE